MYISFTAHLLLHLCTSAIVATHTHALCKSVLCTLRTTQAKVLQEICGLSHKGQIHTVKDRSTLCSAPSVVPLYIVCVCMCACVSTCVHVHACCMCLCLCRCMYVCARTCLCMRVCVCVCVSACVPHTRVCILSQDV